MSRCDLEEWQETATFALSQANTAPDESPFDWSPDGERIAFVNDGVAWVVTLAERHGAWQHLADGVFNSVRWQPDGNGLVLTGGDRAGMQNTIGLMGADGNLVDLLADKPVPEDLRITGAFGWLNADTLLFGTHRGTGVQDLWQLSLSSGQAERLVPAEDELDDADQPQGGPYFLSPVDAHLMVIDQFATHNLVLLDIDSSEQTWLSRQDDATGEAFQDWRPDGMTFLYTQWFWDADALPELWQYDVQSGERTRLLEKVETARYSPDGQYIAAVLGVDGSREKPQVAVYDTTTYAVSTLFEDEETNIDSPSWSQDGEFVAFIQAATEPESSKELWIVDVANSCASRQLSTVSDVHSLQWSPIGHKLAVQKSDALVILENLP